jgi:hypothetical protein
MKNEARGSLNLRTASMEEVAEAISYGVRKALAHHKRIGNPVVVWDRETKQIVTIPPEGIPDYPDDDPAVEPPAEEPGSNATQS